MEFRQCMQDSGDKDSPHVRITLMKKLPGWMRQWVTEGENRFRLREPTVILTLLPETTEELCKANVRAMVQEDALSVYKLSEGRFRVRLFSLSLAEGLVKFNGRVISGSSQRVGAELVKHEFSVDEIFTFLEQELFVREQAEDYNIFDRAPVSPTRTRETKRSPTPPIQKEDKSVKI